MPNLRTYPGRLLVYLLCTLSLSYLPAFAGTYVDVNILANRGTLDQQFLQVADAVPQFAGVAYEGQLLVAYVAAPETKFKVIRPVLIEALASAFGQEIEAGLANVQLQSVTYSTRELQKHFPALLRLFATKGVAYIDVDEVNNRLAVSVHAGTDIRSLAKTARRAGVPTQMLTFSEVAEFALSVDLRERIRPVPSGVQIRRNGIPGTCTLGVNVRLPDDVGFITASHCTHKLGSVGFTATSFNQATTPHMIGAEKIDPYFYNWSLCPTNAFSDGCRFSDSAYIEYNSSNQNPDMSKIARLGSWGYGPLSTVDDDYDIVSLQFQPFSGERLMKMGRTTGKTAGIAVETCVTMRYPQAWWITRDLGLVCQTVVANTPGVGGNQPIIANSGDSGAPVFKLFPGSSNNAVAFSGILHAQSVGPPGVAGQTFVFSPTFGVLADMLPWWGSVTF